MRCLRPITVMRVVIQSGSLDSIYRFGTAGMYLFQLRLERSAHTWETRLYCPSTESVQLTGRLGGGFLKKQWMGLIQTLQL